LVVAFRQRDAVAVENDADVEEIGFDGGRTEYEAVFEQFLHAALIGSLGHVEAVFFDEIGVPSGSGKNHTLGCHI
jgi:hypothetical protein